ncbi:hypothetical protein RB601_004578 [Gaeumannomyces tritici]
METPFSLAPRGCAACPSNSGLLRCGGCLVVHYCSKEHQIEHRQKHKTSCVAIKKTREALQREEAKLRANPGDMFTPADVFNTGVGMFWGILDTRDYMRARFAAADALLKINNVDAVQASLDHLTDMLRLCRSDNLGVRDTVPFLMLRLGQEQECYDFIKWWAATAQQGHYDWADTSAPHLDIRNANPFEDVDIIPVGGDLAHLVALTLLKIRLFLDLSAFEDDELMHENRIPDPSEFLRPVGKLVKAKVKNMEAHQIPPMSEELARQYRKLCNVVHDKNPNFWDLLHEDGEPSPPAMFSPGSPEEAELVFFHSKRAWNESEDADVMVEAETSKFTIVYRSPPGTTGSVQVNASGSAGGARRILLLCLENEGLFDSVHGGLVTRLNSKTSVQRASSTQGALAKLGETPPPPIIFIADGAISRETKLWQRVIDRLRGGATVILGGLFSSMTRPSDVERMFSMVGLPWKVGTYTRETTKLRKGVLDSTATAGLPVEYSQKAVFLQNVDKAARLYVREDKETDVAVAFAKVENGRLAFIGDVNREEGSAKVIMAMCGP